MLFFGKEEQNEEDFESSCINIDDRISAFVISGMTGSTCVFLLHQPELPEQIDQLRK